MTAAPAARAAAAVPSVQLSAMTISRSPGAMLGQQAQDGGADAALLVVGGHQHGHPGPIGPSLGRRPPAVGHRQQRGQALAQQDGARQGDRAGSDEQDPVDDGHALPATGPCHPNV